MDIPEEADRIGAELGWGQPLAAFHGLTGTLGGLFFVTMICGAAVIIGLAYIAMEWFNSPPHRFANAAGMAVAAISIPFLFLAAGVAAAVYYPPCRVHVFSEGMVYLSGSTRHVCPWAHIKYVWQNTTATFIAGIQTSRAGAVTIEMSDGTTWSADSTPLRGAVDLIPIIQE